MSPGSKKVLAVFKAAHPSGVTAVQFAAAGIVSYRQEISRLRASGYKIDAREVRVKGKRVTTFHLDVQSGAGGSAGPKSSPGSAGFSVPLPSPEGVPVSDCAPRPAHDGTRADRPAPDAGQGPALSLFDEAAA